MASSDAKNVITRIEEVICDGRGVARTIDAEYRFRRGLRPDSDGDKASVDAHVQKRMIAYFESMEPDPQVREMEPTLTYATSIRIDLAYFMKNPRDHSAMIAALGLVPQDVHRVRKALCYPGNLEETEAGDACGLASDSLVYLSMNSRVDTKTNRLILVSLRFRGWLTLTTV